MEEKVVKPAEEFYRQVLDQLFDGVVFLDLERRITYWNRGAEKISGYSSQEVLGRHCEEVFNPTDEEGNRLSEKFYPALVAMKDEAQSEIDLYLFHKEGYRVPVRVRAVPLRDDLGKVIGAVEIFRDHSVFVAARHRAQELQRLADLDALTHLGNRRFSEVNLGAALQTRRP
jgi:PAS domain S-box-containing protein